jgi:hypothetical protein
MLTMILKRKANGETPTKAKTPRKKTAKAGEDKVDDDKMEDDKDDDEEAPIKAEEGGEES